ncbi:PorT family protein [Cryomorpha ignava]|uniref:PorT family protein n=1 Tax=Cryomorpha ignava TaxID=101383 RepID=A0A7K3WU14_9FLAO|nr:outer membrane beta-barrel protein [Cryomorpha ignava]NEN24382.1 PorT family protein [Cryomorpha ignava]
MKEQSQNSNLNKKFEDFSYPVDDTNWDAISARIPSGSGVGFLGEKFSAHSVSPSRNVWRGIEATLRPSSRKRFAGWWWYGAAAAVLLFGYFAFLQFNAPENQSQIAGKHSETRMDVKKDSETAKPDTESIGSETNNIESNSTSAEANTSITTATNKPKSEKSNSRPDNAHSGSTGQVSLADKKIAGRETELTIPENGLVNGNTSKTPTRVKRILPTKIIGIDPEIDFPVLTAALAGEIKTVEPANLSADHKKQKSSPFYDGTETTSENQFAILAGSQLAFAGSGDMDMAEANNFDVASGFSPGSEIGTADSSVPTSLTYSTPIYYGVNGEIKFWKRLSAGLGLGYLRMQTTAESKYGLQTLAKETESKYLSIPVYLKFNFVDKPKFTAYTTAGNAIDLLIWQKTTETFFDGQTTESRSVSDEPKGNQANLYAGLGMSFKFTKHLGLFAEGSLMRYYSITGSNFYSQQNLWPGMRFGALISF